MNWPDNIWEWLGLLAVSTLLCVAITAIGADHSTTRYYLERSGEGMPCIRGEANWHVDPTVFCSTNVDELLRVLHEANRSLGIPVEARH